MSNIDRPPEPARLPQPRGTTVHPICEWCGKRLTIFYDLGGEDRSAIVCFSCESPSTLCRECMKMHGFHSY